MTSSILTSSTTSTTEPTKKSKSKKKKYKKKVKNILTKKRRPLEPTSTPPPIQTPSAMQISTETSTRTSKPSPTSTPPPSEENTEMLYYPKTAEDCYKYGYIGRLQLNRSEIKWGASSRWLTQYCLMRNSDQMTIRKTHPTL